VAEAGASTTAIAVEAKNDNIAPPSKRIKKSGNN